MSIPEDESIPLKCVLIGHSNAGKVLREGTLMVLRSSTMLHYVMFLRSYNHLTTLKWKKLLMDDQWRSNCETLMELNTYNSGKDRFCTHKRTYSLFVFRLITQGSSKTFKTIGLMRFGIVSQGCPWSWWAWSWTCGRTRPPLTTSTRTSSWRTSSQRFSKWLVEWVLANETLYKPTSRTKPESEEFYKFSTYMHICIIWI